jgi:hypothetical protein
MHPSIFLLACAVAFPSYASDWRNVTKTNDAIIYVDYGSVAPRGKYMRAWVMFDYILPKQTVTYPQKEYKSGKMLWAFDCEERTSATAQYILLSGDFGDGEPVHSLSTSWGLLKFDDVVPDSIGEIVLNVACASRKAAPQKSGKGKSS